MTEMQLGTFLIVGLLCMLVALDLWIGIALVASSVIVLFLFLGPSALGAMGYVSYNSVYSFSLTAMPLFIFMGLILVETQISERIFTGISGLCSHLPGGLLHASILGSGIFGAISGSGSAAVATITSIGLPVYKTRPQYNMTKALGAMGGGSILGIMIPPSIPMIIYGALVGESVGKLFMAGVFPGIILMFLMMGYIILNHLMSKQPPLEKKVKFIMALKQLTKIWPVLILVFLCLGTIYIGVCTPTEAGGLGAFGALMLGFAFRELTWQKINKAGLQTLKICSMVGIMMFGSALFSYALSSLAIPQTMTRAIIQMAISPWLILMLIFIIYFILGSLTGGIPSLMIVTPLVYPILIVVGQPLGWDGIWFGVLSVLFLEQAGLTPPVGVNLFVICGVAKIPVDQAFMALLPYIIVSIIALIIFALVPQVATWLPSILA